MWGRLVTCGGLSIRQLSASAEKADCQSAAGCHPAPQVESNMNHLTEEELILHYYGEEGDALSSEKHLEECAGCRELYGSLQRVLNVVDALPVPELGPAYGAEVWRRIEHRVPARRRRRWLPA